MRSKSVLMLLGTYSPAAHRGIARFAAEHRWHLQMDMARIPVIPYGWSGDGIIAGLGEWEEPLRFLNSPEVAGIPVVDIYNIHPEIAIPRISGDHSNVGQLAAEHFVSRGWQHYAWFSRVDHHVAQLRFRGFQSSLSLNGFSAQILPPGPSVQKYNWAHHLRKLADALQAAPKPLAVFAYNDFDAALVMQACLESNLRVPDDVAILGVDNNELVVESLQVSLSSVQLDHERIGYQGALLLQSLMEGGPPPTGLMTIPPKGVAVRASTDTFAVNHLAVRRALHFIKDHLQRSLGVDEIVQASGVSRRALEEAFTKELRSTIHGKLMQLRVQKARELLLNTDLGVEEIAGQTGFCHAPHLHRVFKENYGHTPRACRVRG